MERDSGSNSKAKEAQEASSAELPQEVIPHDPAPAYQESPASASASRSLSASASASTLQQQQPAGTSALVPTVTSPFNFPTDGKKDGSATAAAPPGYDKAGLSGDSSTAQRAIAFPQITPDPDSPFLPAYAPVLLSYGITEDTWTSFLTTISAFLTAKVSDRALSHAADMAAHLGEGHKNLGKNVAAHAKSIGKNVADNAKRGNILGAAAGLIGGSISLPISTALGIVGTTLSLPGQAIGAVTKKPKTPQERAAAYAAVANEEWLHMRGLHAHLFDSAGLAHLLGLPSDSLLSMAWKTKELDASSQLRALQPHIAELKVDETSTLQLKMQTLWLVLIPQAPPS
ncbi:subunit of the rna polymerase ii mediator complex [Trichoderma arundinaceum]|uniref:Subunit of the rna polymerase ii mediator complex n=1 Tax=Trichoderma arundinaceum TaxID=490622 RepID=A0A395NRU3_TRIAR|nr:subunit of the rna polymerase ii mediator complex [Trichoderma arundinaceum]